MRNGICKVATGVAGIGSLMLAGGFATLFKLASKVESAASEVLGENNCTMTPYTEVDPYDDTCRADNAVFYYEASPDNSHPGVHCNLVTCLLNNTAAVVAKLTAIESDEAVPNMVAKTLFLMGALFFVGGAAGAVLAYIQRTQVQQQSEEEQGLLQTSTPNPGR